MDPKTGFLRDGYCHIIPSDSGHHSVCVVITDDFLTYSASVGNDLSTPRPEFEFPGLKEGDKWCLCASRWKQAYDDGCAPQIVPESTHEKALTIMPLSQLLSYAKK